MPAKSRFTRLDAFAKTVEDARVRTTSGGIVTLVSLVVILWLVWGEWADYRRVVVLPELIVDKSRGERMEIHLNMTFPRLPCELLTLDVMDVSGEQQMGVVHGLNKVRLSPVAEGGKVIDVAKLELHAQNEVAVHLNPEYCGQCGGAPPPPNTNKPGCCNTCEEVREAYALKSWAFGKGENIEQCQREGYAEKINAQRREGCRIEGDIRVNKVIGNFHIAPGRSFSTGNMHVHDLDTYMDRELSDNEKHTMSHIIHQLRFGPQLSDELSRRWQWTDHHHTNPLDDTQQFTDEPAYNYNYYIKVVSTSYLPLGWDSSQSDQLHGDDQSTPLGLHGAVHGAAGSLETHQYSVTSHKRSLHGGNDAAEGHKERVHAEGGIPGVFFNYDISPMKVVNREVRPKTFTGFLTGVCAVIGGTLTVAAAVDRFLYEGSRRMRKSAAHTE
ncbi:COPII-coated vesicle membrane protein Erv46, putative [Talaromyces stipitatus ATCC 10500]|uniref:Endoplasmic reticulum-Golgi intermediate compartment protein n=1 Tax=Talaromyces stipitatus (strain ATCC 10500 / CBS 375.48 / QM 6759 / NRRL 1006) TaxID=441959 RepID=B8MH43_TALSN|nr:COPII-coated vesicle membrane protein Erv46, putative [Talaromyces stipitatus ATCC 10500]EED16857.1 COPII-coated vesicle membrane protein Erv46, putative [Talaromyces stipitatus ATCC 10500]